MMPIGWDAGDFGGSAGGVTPEELGALVRPAPAGTVVRWTRWRTAADERVCPECGPLDGQTWPANEGPRPPLHDHCRCAREFAFVEWGSRG